jgi:dihydrodipicolinate synthase/N-acetylneuraminate lyase
MEKRYPRTIMATACIPWTPDFNLDEEIFRQSIVHLLNNGIRSIYLFGTAGEGYAVSREQYVQIVKVFLDEMRRQKDALPMVGIISLSMSEIKERIAMGMDLGVRDFQISFPSWGAVSPEEGVGFLKTICAAFPGARFMHYNNGLRSKTRLSMKYYIRLADEVPNLAAVKNPGISLMELQEFHSVELPIEFFNLEYAYGFASLISSTSLLISVCNLNYRQALRYFDAGTRADAAEIIACHRDFQRIYECLFTNVPPGKIDGAYDKVFTHYHLPAFPLRLYPPYEGPGEAQFKAFAAAFRTQLPHWV